jgi:hypothetical protein
VQAVIGAWSSTSIMRELHQVAAFTQFKKSEFFTLKVKFSYTGLVLSFLVLDLPGDRFLKLVTYFLLSQSVNIFCSL